MDIEHYIWPFAGCLYMEELNYIREGCKSDIRYEGIKKVRLKNGRTTVCSLSRETSLKCSTAKSVYDSKTTIV